MRNLKKLLALIVALCVIATFTVPAFAADAAAAAPSDSKICSDLGVLQGDGNGVTDTYLAKGTTRLQAAILYLRLLGKEDEALAETSTDNFADANKITWAAGKNVLAYLKKNPSLGWVGDGVNFDPNGAANAQMIYKVMLTALGYVQGTDFQYADAVSFAGSLGLTKIAYTTTVTNNDMATAIVEALKANIKDGSKTLAADLVAKNIITAAAADATGLVPAYKPVALDVSGAVAINSKVVELTLGTAATAPDVAAAAISVKDSAGKAIAVTGVKLSPWTTDGTSVLATLESDTVAGTLYTLTVGTKSVNFGGKAKDTDAPAAPAVVSTDYNEVTLTFGEAIDINTAKVTITKKYGDKAALATSAVKYDGSNKLVYTTADQADATLYGVKVEGVTDMAGNVMTTVDTLTFVGKAKPTANEVVKGAKALDYKTIYVELGTKVDPATVTAANFTLAEMYGTKASVAIASAALATTSQAGKYNGTYSDDQKTLASKKDVVLTLTGEVKDATLYKVVAANLKTLYGVAESTTDSDTYATFTGKSKPASDSLTYTAAATSNTTVKLTFTNDLDKATAENIANYSIAKAYGDKAALAVTKASLDDTNIVTLTVAAMSIDMYKITALNIKDIYGNTINTSSDANIKSFAGKAVAAKIDGFISVTDNSGTSGTIRVIFNRNFGAGGLDVASYFIDKGIGYPSKVTKVDDATVDLTVPKTDLGTLYTLTVKGVSNADGVAMDTAGISKTFVGTGAQPGLATLDGAQALDSKTLKLFFSKNVSDITGFNTTDASTLAGAITISGGNGTSLGAVSYAYIDPADATSIIAYTTTSDFKDGGSDDMYTATISGAVTGLDSASNAKSFAENLNDAAKIKVDGVVAVNNKTLDVYFNQPVRKVNPGFAYVETGATAGLQAGVDSQILSTRSIASDNTVWEVSLDVALTNVQYSLVLAAYNNTLISNIDLGAATLNVLDDTLSYAFAGNGTEDKYVSSVYAVGIDTRTIKVMFPEDMDQAQAENTVNYAVYGTVTGSDTLVSAGKIALAKYDSKVVTLTTNNDFTATSDGRYYLVISSAIHNALGTKTVQTDATTPLRTEFALGTASPANLLVSSVSAAGQDITITFNQQFKTVADVTYAVNSSTEVLKYLKIKVNGSTELTASDINNVVAKLGSTAGPSTSFVDTIVITVGPALTLNGQGTVELVNTATATGINNQTQDTSMSPVVFVQKAP